jgi:hypothetical protein
MTSHGIYEPSVKDQKKRLADAGSSCIFLPISSKTAS